MSKTCTSRIKRTLIALALLHIGWAVAGALYIWVDAEGNKHISDRPPIGEAYNTKLNTTKKMTGTAPGKKLFEPATASTAASTATSGASAGSGVASSARRQPR